jgi:CubicO group peptidase (beta-lactamase class C family)
VREQATGIPPWVTFPNADWVEATPEQAGFRQPELDRLLAQYDPSPSTFWGERHPPEDFGAVLTRGGYLVQAWGRAHDYRHQTASVGKAFTLALLGLAVEKLGLDPGEAVWRTWTGAGQMSHPHKLMDSEHHRAITWRQLADHEAGFAIESAYHWRQGLLPAEPWIRERWSGDPDHDMYALRPPGTRYYSSANYARLGQALTALFAEDLKAVLDRELLGLIGVPPDRWHWMSLAEAHAATGLYPDCPGYAEYADQPHAIGGMPVRGGPGWVCMAAADLARFGLLVATGGVWEGERLLGAEWLASKSGGNWSTVVGDRHSFVAGARVATENLPGFLWVPDFVEYRFPDELLRPDGHSVQR